MAACVLSKILLFVAIVNNARIISDATAARASSPALRQLSAKLFSRDFFEYAAANATATSATSECVAQLTTIQDAMQRNEEIAYKFVDAWGKFPAGILYGHLLEMGNYDECVDIKERVDEQDDFIAGKYCLSSWPFDGFGSQAILKIGICIPDACASDQMDTILKDFANSSYGLVIDEAFPVIDDAKCSVRAREPFKPLDWVAIGVFIILGIFLAVSTFYDCWVTSHGGKPHPLLTSFSVRANLQQLFHITPQTDNPNVLPCLHGIRCLSIVWIIFIHCYMLQMLSPQINNITVNTWFHSPVSMFYQSGTNAVDSFFFLSGLLVVLVGLRDMEKNLGKVNVPLMYIHRYLRLTPVLALAVLYFMTLYRYMGEGPVWQTFISSYQLCEETWWQTLLYVQNYAAVGRMCLGHSWYLAVDMQFYIISPLILIIIWKWQKKALVFIATVGLLLAAFLFSIVIIEHLSIFAITQGLGVDNGEMRKIYYSTHTRCSPWIIGIIFGYCIHRRKGRHVELSKRAVLLGWTIALALLLTVIFALFPKTQPDATLTAVEEAFYLALSRIAWPFALCWVVFACINGHGGPINQFLSWSLWQPLSKLSYCMYIWHLLIVTANAGRTKTNTYFSDYDVMLNFWSNFGITLLVSIVMYLAIEAPMAVIEKCLLPKNAPKATARTDPQPNITISREFLCEPTRP